MATEFICKILPGGTQGTNCDYTSCGRATSAGWQNQVKNDLTLSTIKVFSIASGGGLIEDGASVVGNTSGATATCVHETYGKNQIMLKSISGVFQNGETIQKSGDATKIATLTNAGDSVIAVAEGYAGLDAYQLIIDGWTTSATNGIIIRTLAAQRHTGAPSTGYRINCGASDSDAVNIKENYVSLIGIAIESKDGNSQRCLNINTTLGTSLIILAYCFFINTYSGYPIVDLNPGANCTLKIYNSIMRQATGSPNWCLYLQSSANTYLYNNTCVGTAANYGGGAIIGRVAGTVLAKNNISDMNGATGCSAYSGTFSASSTNNHSSDTTAPGSNSVKSHTPTYVNLASNDVKLASGSCKDAGANLSADANIAFSDDIIGTARPQGTNWDIGASEIIQAAAFKSAWAQGSNRILQMG